MGDDRVFSPDEALAPEQTLELVYTTVCPSGLEPGEEVYAFTAWRDAAIVLRAPELWVSERGFHNPDAEDGRARIVRMQYFSPDDQGSARHLMEHHLRVDGEPVPLAFQDGQAFFELRSECQEPSDIHDTCGGRFSYPSGPHTIEAWSTIIGETGEPERATMVVDLSCDEACAPPTTDDDDTPPSDDDGDGTATDTSTSGCSISSTAANDLPAWLAPALALLIRRRRKRGPATS